MPGPLATTRLKRAAAPNSPNAKTSRRLKRRQDAYVATNGRHQMHMPGSQNRKK